MNATLTLVGAGPGDPDLITLKGVHAIKQADVILYDALIDTTLLDYARKEAICVYVGKRAGMHYMKQHEIHNLILDYASKYTNIVRLKGGDPFVFGRSKEEIDLAKQNGLHIEVIPGVSSAIAVPELQGIPLTARGVSDSFWVLTGTTKCKQVSKDLYNAAQSEATVVILMGISQIHRIVEIFEAENKGDVPVAIIQEGTTKKERMVRGTVSSIIKKIEEKQIGSPAIIVVGDVVRLMDSKVF